MEKFLELKEHFKKASTLIDSISNNISIIEKDILLQYIRDFYIKVVELNIGENKTEEKLEIFNKKAMEVEVEDIKEEEKEQSTSNFSIDFVETTDELIEEQSVVEENNIIEQTIKDVIVKKTDYEQVDLFSNLKETKTIGEQLRKETISINDILAQNSQHDNISSRMSQKPISDIKSLIGIGDRFLFIRELFNGNGEAFEEVVSNLNSLKSFDEASGYLSSKFDWSETQETVNSFMNIVKRRYL